MYRFPIFCLLALLQPSIVPAADNICACEAPARIQVDIDRANRDSIKNLLEQYPGDLWVQRAYIDLMVKRDILMTAQNTGIPIDCVEDSVIAQFREDYENHPGNPQAAYLYAYTLIHTDTAASIKILTDIIRATPDFPLSYMTLSILHGYSGFQDQEKVRTYTEAFLARCPDTIYPRIANNALQLDRSETLVAYVKTLRERISGKTDTRLLSLYQLLWQLESKIALPEEQEKMRGLIKGDLEFLEGLKGTQYQIAGLLLLQGYERIGDTAAVEKLRTQNTPYASTFALTGFYKAISEWSGMNPAPPPAADEATRTEYFRKQLEFLDSWMDRVPDNPTLLSSRFNALASIPDTSNEALIQEGDRILAIQRRSTGNVNSSTSMEVLRTWALRDILLDRIPSLVHEFMTRGAQTPFQSGPGPQSDLVGVSQELLMAENLRWSADTSGWSILATVHLKNHQIDQAKEVLGEWEKDLKERRRKADEITARKTARLSNPPATATGATGPVIRQLNIVDLLENSIVSGISGDEAKYYEACARLASAENRSLDALTFYQSSLRLMYGRSAFPPDFMNQDAGKAAESLWKELGGTDAGWEAWLESIRTMPAPKFQSGPQWAMSNRSIPDFSLPDQNGKTWTLAGLKGKTTLINVWATWCGPCRQELPHLQKLYEQVKNRSDVQVITLNIDEDRSLVKPYLEKNALAFPSLYAQSFVKEFAGAIGIPTTWISDSTGTIRFETLGFGGDGSQWLQNTLKQIESVGSSAR